MNIIVSFTAFQAMYRIFYIISNARHSIMAQLVAAAFVLFLIFNSESSWKAETVKQLETESNVQNTACLNSCPKDQWKRIISKTLTNIKLAKKAGTLGIALLHISKIQQQLENVEKLLSNSHFIDPTSLEHIFDYFTDLKVPGSHDINVCPEKYDENRRDYPLFRHGWYQVKCKNKELKDVLSIGLHDPSGGSQSQLKNILKDIGETYPGITVYVAGYDISKLPAVKSVKLVVLQPSVGGKPVGWNDIIKTSKTQFLLIGRNMTHWKPEDAQLERLVRQLTDTSLDIAGGATRDIKGRWRMGCDQLYLRNFRIQYIPGYYSSLYSCLLCDVISGPFVIRANKFIDAFDESLSEEAQFEDLFINRFLNSKRSWLCPDSMFYTQESREDISKNKQVWTKIGKKYQVSEIFLSDGDGHILPCNDTQLVKTLLNSPCIQKDLNDGIHHVMTACREMKIMCELSEGSVMGAVKFGKSLPWDVDADLVVQLPKNQENRFKQRLETKGYKVTIVAKM